MNHEVSRSCYQTPSFDGQALLLLKLPWHQANTRVAISPLAFMQNMQNMQNMKNMPNGFKTRWFHTRAGLPLN